MSNAARLCLANFFWSNPDFSILYSHLDTFPSLVLRFCYSTRLFPKYQIETFFGSVSGSISYGTNPCFFSYIFERNLQYYLLENECSDRSVLSELMEAATKLYNLFPSLYVERVGFHSDIFFDKWEWKCFSYTSKVIFSLKLENLRKSKWIISFLDLINMMWWMRSPRRKLSGFYSESNSF
jgi:hypothetical protein